MIINLLCQEGGYRIITVEEPIEYVFPAAGGSVVTQREVGHDVHSFADGLKHGLRQDPDVILVGEIRDRDTGQMALSAAETGHLVFATMHTRDAKGASRYADLFPQSVQNEIRAQLASGLRAVISQHLLPSAQRGGKRELALEVMFTNPAIASSIRFGKLETVDNYIVTGCADGMVSLDESVKRLMTAGKITRETAEYFVSDKAYLNANAVCAMQLRARNAAPGTVRRTRLSTPHELLRGFLVDRKMAIVDLQREQVHRGHINAPALRAPPVRNIAARMPASRRWSLLQLAVD